MNLELRKKQANNCNKVVLNIGQENLNPSHHSLMNNELMQKHLGTDATTS